jgi:CheY-like chemotaxis protein
MKKIFIVDDDEMYQLILRRNLIKLCPELTVKSFGHGGEAINELKNIIAAGDPLPDVILLDINMPVMDGWQFLKSIEPTLEGRIMETKIYVVSTSLDARDKEKAQGNVLVTEYISKPIPATKLREILCCDKPE